MKYYILFILFCLVLTTQAQIPKPEILSPNATGMQQFGDMSMNYFQGTPNISVPVYSLKSGSITLPVSLSYNKDIVKAGKVPGWVGAGWTLNCGGIITRTVNGKPDEYMEKTSSYEGFIEAGANTVNPESSRDFYSSKLTTYYSFAYDEPGSGIGNHLDLSADEFRYNILGHSGRFYYSTDGWVVMPDDGEVKVECLGYSRNSINRKNYNVNFNHRYINGFKLTLDNGTQVTFGSESSAIEFSNNYKSNYYSSYEAQGLIADSWRVKSITDVDGNTILFTYKEGYPTCEVSYRLEQVIGGTFRFNWANCSGFGSIDDEDDIFNRIKEKEVDLYDKDGKVIFPVYLDRITAIDNHSVTSSIAFESSEVDNNKTYPLDYLHKTSSTSNSNYDILSTSWLKSSRNFKWLKLDQIVITEPTNEQKTFDLIYESEEGGYLPVLALYKVSQSNSDGNEEYNFKYYDCSDWNWITKGGRYGFLSSGTGLIKKITYPTKGSTEFIWESNKFWKYLDNRGVLRNSTKDDKILVDGTIILHPPNHRSYYTGGSRISSITYKGIGNNTLKTLSYSYQTEEGESSGILNGEPELTTKFTFNDRLPLEPIAKVSFTIKDVNGLVQYKRNGPSHVGYSRVVETNETNDVTKTFEYYNYGSRSSKLISCIGWKAFEDQFIDAYDYSLVGKLFKLTEESSQRRHYKQVNYLYNANNISSRYYNRLIIGRTYSFSFETVCGSQSTNQSVRLLFAHAVTEKPGIIKVRQKIERNFYVSESNNNNNKIVTDYEYNEFGQLIEEIQTLNNTEKLINKYVFPNYLAKWQSKTPPRWHSTMVNMCNDNIMNIPILSETLYEKNGSAEVIKANFLEFENSFPYKIKDVYTLNKEGLSDLYNAPLFTYFIDQADMKLKASCKYDENGNIIQVNQYSGPITYYFWGSNKYVPIAKVISAEPLNVTQTLRDNIYHMGIDTRRAEITSNLGSGKYMIYTYDAQMPDGIICESDPNGRKVHYTYDEFNRLQSISNHNNQTLKEYKYHFSNPEAN